MGRLCREQFVHLHSQPLLENLHNFFCLHYEGRPYRDPKSRGETQGRTVSFLPPPARGDFDVRRVLESKYFFH